MQGIYKIVNPINKKIYVGSSKDIKKRFRRHLRDLKKGIHHNVHLQRSFNKNSEETFTFEVLEETSALFEREQHYIDLLKPEYNIGSVNGGDNYTNHPDKEKLRLRLIQHLADCPKPKPRYGKDNGNYKDGLSGKQVCKCGNLMRSDSKTCSNCMVRVGSKNPFHGKTHSTETKEKISKANKGKLPTNVKKISVEGKVYISATEASRVTGIKMVTLAYRARKGIMNTHYVD